MKINFRNRACIVFMAVILLCNFIPMPVHAMPVDSDIAVNETDVISETVSGNNITDVQEAEKEDIIQETDTSFLYLYSVNENDVFGEELLHDTEQKVEEIVLASSSPIELRVDGVMQEGTLSVAVLRGEKNSEQGSMYLFNQKDDWSYFEVVEENPFFEVEVEEGQDKLDTYLTILPKIAEEKEVSDEYDYFLRVTFSALDEDVERVAITTLPVIIEDMSMDSEPTDVLEEKERLPEDDLTKEDKIAGEDGLAEENELTDESKLTDEEVLEKAPEKTSEEISEDTSKEVLLYENSSAKEEVNEEANAEQVMDEFTGDVSGQDITVNHTNVELEEVVITVSKVTLNKNYEILHPGEVWKAKATVLPEGLDYPVIWSSSNPEAAIVDEVGTITAVADGSAVITAECEGKTAVITIDVVTEDAIINNDFPEDENGNLIEISDEIWIAGFEKESEAFVYNGGKITQNLRVYHKGTLLKEKTDYTLSYKNHVNASPYNGAKAPSVTITMKGQYSGSRTLYYTIWPREIDENGQAGYEQIIYYAKNLKLTAPNVYYGSKKLVSNKDFVCDYSTLPENYKKGDSYEEGKAYEYTVNGIGNYTGSFTMKLTILKDKNFNLGNATVTLDKKQYVYAGTSLSEEDVKPVSVKIGKKLLEEELYTYEVEANGTGKGYLVLYPTEEGISKGYRGSKKVEFKVVGDRNLKDVIKGSSWQNTVTFSGAEVSKTGGMCQSKSEILIYQSDDGDEILTEGIDYSVKYSNHKKVGKATVIFTGMGRYTGSYKATYQIVPNTNLFVEWANMKEDTPVTVYQKGGANPAFTLKEVSESGDKIVLNAKTDYSVKLTNHQKVGTMTCVITGKGNYKGFSHTAEIQVLEADISAGTMVLNDKQYSDKKSSWWKSSVTIMDVNGKKLTAGSDYDKNLIYSYQGIKDGIYPKAGDIVYVTAKGLNNYAGSIITGSYRIYQSKLSDLTIVIDSQEYTGREITLAEEDIHVYASAADRKSGKEMDEDCYEIIGYKNNLKTGTAKVTFRGKGNYGGTRECSFKITKKKYLTTRVTSIVLNEKTITMGAGNTRQLTAMVLPEDAINKTVIWSSSNSKVAEVNTDGVVYAKAPGTAKIKALSQDTGKSATCTVKVAVIPVVSFELNQTELTGKEGDIYQLQAVKVLPEDASYQTIEWESTHPEIASVDEMGTVSLHKAGMAVIKAFAAEGAFVRKCLVFVNGSDTQEKPEGEYLTPQMFRTCEQEDDTEAFNQAISQLTDSCNTLYVPAGTYKIDALKRIRLKSDMNLIMSENAVLQAINNSDKFYDIVYANNISGVNITGGTIVGERYGHGDTAGEWGMGIGLYDCTDVTIMNVVIKDCWGDGIYIGSKHEEDSIAGCSQITIKDCDLYNNRRNNLAIVCGDYVTIDNCTFKNANGTAPEYGIDIETNNADNPCEHITVSNSLFDYNGQAGIGIVTAANDITISDCMINGDFINYAGTYVTLENTIINGETDARIGLLLEGENRFNDGTEVADELVATFRPDKENFVLEEFHTDEDNVMFAEVREDMDASFGKALLLKRLTGGTQDAGYCLDLGEWTKDGSQILEKGATYRFEYVVKGTGQWAIKTDQTAWYPCVPMKDIFSTGMVSYKAGSAADCRILLYATEKTKNMYLYIDTIQIYKVN